MLKAPISILHNGIYYYFYAWDIDLTKKCKHRNFIRYGVWTKDKSIVQNFTYEEVMQIKPWNFDENVFLKF